MIFPKLPNATRICLITVGHLLTLDAAYANERTDRLHQMVLNVLTTDGAIASPQRQEMLTPNRLRQAQVFTRNQVREVPRISTDRAERVTGLIVRFANEEVKALTRANLPPPSALVEEVVRVANVPLVFGRAMSMDAYVFRFPIDLSMSEAQIIVDRLRAVSSIEKIYPDIIQKPYFSPNDPYANLQHNLMSPTRTQYYGGIDAVTAWDITQGSPNTVVAVVDTGVGPHPEFSSRLLPGYDFVSDDRFSNDGDGRDSNAIDPGNWRTADECGNNSPAKNSNWHGTHVAGIIGAQGNNSSGIAGINWNTRILPVRVLGKCGGTQSDIIDGLLWAAGIPIPGIPTNSNPAKIINASLGGFAPQGCANTVYPDAINRISAKGALLIVAAGNSSSEAENYIPASCEGVFSIGAVDPFGSRASYSNFSFTYKLHLSAPGGDITRYGTQGGIYSTVNSGITVASSSTIAPSQGTSMAAPHVAGIASLALAVDPAISPEFLRLAIVLTSRPFPSTSVCSTSYPVCGLGIADAYATLQGVQALKPYQLVYEFRNTSTNHFFRTGSPTESSAIKEGSAGPGWYDSGDYFLAWRDGTQGASPVCRFYSQSFNSHFYTANSNECNSVKSNRDWKYEGIAYYAKLPVNGICPASSTPVYRLYNNRHMFNDGNHRFTTDRDIAAEMTVSGWKNEGVTMCAFGG